MRNINDSKRENEAKIQNEKNDNFCFALNDSYICRMSHWKERIKIIVKIKGISMMPDRCDKSKSTHLNRYFKQDKND